MEELQYGRENRTSGAYQDAVRAEGHRLLKLGYTPLPADPHRKHPPYAWSEYRLQGLTHDTLDGLFDRHTSAVGLGMVTDGILVVDVDVARDCTPNPITADLMKLTSLTAAPAVTTPRGGMHYYFRVPPGAKINNSASKVAPHVDIRAEGGFIMLPPSVRPNGRWAWRNAAPLDAPPTGLPEPPGWLLYLIRASDRPTHTHECSEDQPIPAGTRNNTLFKYACSLHAQGVDENDISRRLAKTNRVSCQPPLEEKEIVGIVRSVGRYPTPELTIADDKPTQIKLLTMQELVNRPAARWLIPNLIPDAGLGLLVSAPAAGKSFFLLELAQSICRGCPVFGDPTLLPGRSGWVLALLPEAAASWGGRTQAYLDYHERQLSDDFTCCIQPNNLADTDIWSAVMQTISAEIGRRGEPPVLVIVDTLSASIPGLDENQQAAITPLMSNLQALVSMGICVIVAHHPSKAGGDYRGSSVLAGSCDWMISIVKTGNVREFRARKLRDAREIDNIAFEIIPHGESAVCVGTAAQGPWGVLEETIGEHPGLGEVLRQYGLADPDEQPDPLSETDNFTNGVRLSVLHSAWNKNDPIQPASSEDEPEYKKIYNRRQTALLGLINALIIGRVLEVQDGEFSRKKRDMSVVVRTVVEDV